MKISDILAQDPISTDTAAQVSSSTMWGDVFRFDETVSERNFMFRTTEETDAQIASTNIKQHTYWADRSQGQELNCIFIDDIPVVLYETTDSWDHEGSTWVLDAELYMMLYDTIKVQKELVLYSLDDDIDSAYIGIETPSGAYYS